MNLIDTHTLKAGDNINSLRLPASCGRRAWWMQMRSPGLKPSAVTIHARSLSASLTADRSPRKMYHSGSSAVATSALPPKGQWRACCCVTGWGMWQATLPVAAAAAAACPRLDSVAHLGSYFSHPTELTGQNRADGCVSRGRRHTQLSLTHTNIHTYRHTSTHELTGSLDGACQVQSRTPPPFPPPLLPPPSRGVCSSTHAPLDGSIHNGLCKPTLRQWLTPWPNPPTRCSSLWHLVKGNANTSVVRGIEFYYKTERPMRIFTQKGIFSAVSLHCNSTRDFIWKSRPYFTDTFYVQFSSRLR